MMGGWTQDIRVALRQFRRAPSFVATAVLTIALGIGATVSIFSVVDAVLLKPLPYADADELVAIWEWNVPRDRARNVANPGNYAAWRDGSTTIARMAGVSLAQPATVLGLETPDEAMVQYASPDFFDVLGLEAATGRTFSRESAERENFEVVLSDRYWRERFGGAADAIGRAVRINGSLGTVVGILPPAYVAFGEGTDAWLAMSLDRGDQTNSGRWLMVVGRLASGTTVEAADAELKAISEGLEEAFPDFNGGWSVQVVGLVEDIVGDVRTLLWTLLVSVGFLLLIACANVANLFLVRTTARQQELAVRASLGAPRRALARQLFVESLVISSGGSALGVVASSVAIGWMANVMPSVFSLPRIEGAAIDGRALVFAALVTVAAAMTFGLVPALRSAARAPRLALGAGSRGASPRRGAARNVLVVAEVGLSMVLLTGAALFGRSFVALSSVDDGIEPENVVVGRVNLTSPGYSEARAKVAFFDELIDRLASSPEVGAAGGVTFLPMDGPGAATSYWPADRPEPDPDARRAADIRNVSGEYFQAMGIELLRGRWFDGRDRADGPQTVIVNRNLADRYWPDASPVGQRVVVNWVDEEPWEIVGVVEDVLTAGPAESPREAIYINYAKGTFFPWQQITLRGAVSSAHLADLLRREVTELDPELPVGRVRLMRDVVGTSVARPRMTAALMTVFAGLATLLAAIGLYGVLAYTVSQRVREIGVRLALGAEPGQVLRMVVGQGMGLIVAGLAAGVSVAVLASRSVSSLLFRVTPADPIAIVGAALILGLVAVLATTIPAWRASHVAPAESLKPD